MATSSKQASKNQQAFQVFDKYVDLFIKNVISSSEGGYRFSAVPVSGENQCIAFKASAMAEAIRETSMAMYSHVRNWAGLTSVSLPDNIILNTRMQMSRLHAELDRWASEVIISAALRNEELDKDEQNKAIMLSFLQYGTAFFNDKLRGNTTFSLYDLLGDKKLSPAVVATRMERTIIRLGGFNGIGLVEVCYGSGIANDVGAMLQLFEGYFIRKLQKLTKKPETRSKVLAEFDIPDEVKKAKAYVRRYWPGTEN